MSILKMSAVSEAPRDRILAMLKYQMADSKTDNGTLTGGYACSPRRAFEEMMLVQRSNRKTAGRQFIPFIVSITPDKPEIPNENYLQAGDQIARIHSDFQCCYALHLDSKTRHLHFLMNAVSFRDGHKYSQSRADLGIFRQKVNDILFHFKFDTIQQKLKYQPDMTDCVRKSDFEFWETEQSISTEPSRLSSGYQLPSGQSIRDFFHPNATNRLWGYDRDPDAPNPYARNRFFEAKRRNFEMNADAQFSCVPSAEYTPATERQMTEPIIPTLTFNLGSTFTGTAEQLAEAQAQLEQQQLNRTGTFALELQQMAQSNGLAVNMQFNIHNFYNLAGDSAEGHLVDPNTVVNADYSEE